MAEIALEQTDPGRARSYRALLTVGVALVAFFLFFFRLEAYPAPWFDEGAHLRVAKNFALNGIYAEYSSEGTRYFGAAVGVGPTVMLPIAAAFKAAGVHIVTGRLVMVAYGVLALLALYALSRQVAGDWGGLLAVTLVLLSPGVDFVYYSRTVVGEVPGILFVLAGLWLWFRPGLRRVVELAGVGLLLGLGSITKNQFALFILPGLLLAFLTNLYYRARPWGFFIIPGIVAGLIFFGWTGIVLFALGGQGDLNEELATLRRASAGAFLILNPSTLERAARLLIDGSVYGALFIPAYLYGLVLALRRDAEGQRFGVLMLFITGGTALFMSSLGWERYAFAPLVLAAPLVVRLMVNLIQGVRLTRSKLLELMRGHAPSTSGIAAVLVAGWLIGVVALPGYALVHAVTTHGSVSAYHTADWLKIHIPPDALIEMWEPELGVLTDHNYHLPPQAALAAAVEAEWMGGAPASASYDFRDFVTPDYVILGPFAKYTRIYPHEFLQDYSLLHTVGEYDVYQRSGAAANAGM